MRTADIAESLGRGLTLVVVVLVLAGIRWLAGLVGFAPDPLAGTTMAVGFLFLAAFLAGRVAAGLGLPKITGYLLVGGLVGPEVLGLLNESNLQNMALLNRLAIGVIAFIAGGELRPSMLQQRGRTIAVMLGCEIGAVLVLVTALLLILRPFVPFLAGFSFGTAAVLALVFASIATIHSPAVTIALLDEQRAAGLVSSTTLGIVVAADVVVVILVTLALSTASAVLTADAGLDAGFLALLAWELVGAIIAGALLGAVVDIYLRLGGAHLPIFVIFLALFGYEISRAIHVEFMLFMLSAGFFVENISPVDGEPLIEAVERVGTFAYALFFALAGASIHLAELVLLWPLALAVVIVRGIGLWGGCRIGARLAGAEEKVRRYTWMGLVSQAGVALGLVTVAERVLPEVGGAMKTLFLAMIAVHELIGPILFRLALARSGELERVPEGMGSGPSMSPSAPAA